MDTYRLALVFSLMFTSLLIWEAWQTDYVRQPAVVAQQQNTSSVPVATDVSVTQGLEADMPQVVANDRLDTPIPMVSTAQPVQPLSASVIHIVTDIYQIDVDTRGGSIIRVLLNDYPNAIESPDIKYELMGTTKDNYFVSQSGFLAGNKQVSAPDHKAIYKSTSKQYQMAEGSDELQVPLFWEKNGVLVKKIFHFKRGEYLIDVEHQVTNQSSDVWSGRQYRQLVRSEPAEQPGDNGLLITYTGPAYYTPTEFYQKVSFDDISDEKLALDSEGGWVAMLQHYYLAAWILNPGEKNHLYSNVTNRAVQPRYIIGAYSPLVSLNVGETYQFHSGFLAAPKLQEKLEVIAPGLELSVDYGFLTFIAKPIFWVLTKIHNVVGNWGWSIIFLTIMIKLMFFHLSATSYRSMANMRKLTPRIKAMKERYTDDKAGMNQAMMEMYKKEKVNPLGGCLPILVQIPVFISLYWVLLEAVELRHAPFMLWINDLSVMDPYFILPLLMGISMFIQQKLNPEPPDPMQAKIMMSLPFVFTIFFAFFPAGLVLYWVINNVLSISQQWYITRKIEAASS